MCGIFGYISFKEPIENKRSILRRMGNLIVHRGPDAEGLWLKNNVGLGHQRLSIIDLSGGTQPMLTPDESIVLVFNGEIYNFQELRKELQAKGFVFRTHSDTEVILNGYAAYGPDIVHKLNGMFAFAIWDAPRKRLFAARDRLGKKPLYFYHDQKRFLFASEMKSILAEPEIARQVDPAAVNQFFSYAYIPAPKTIFQGIQKLRPGHFLLLQDSNLKVTQYWDVEYKPNTECKTEMDYVDKLDSLLQAAVKRRLLSEVPLGAFLSGGIDSSLVVAMMAKASAEPVRTFTIDFTEKGYSEAADARLIAEKFATTHTEFTAQADAVGLLPSLVWHFDEPFADSSALPTYYVSKLAREKVTVILAGDGGDELFAGYNHYRWHGEYAKYKAIPKFLREQILGPLGSALPMQARGKNFLKRLAQLEKYERGEMVELYPPIKDDLFTPEMREQFLQGLDPYSALGYWQNAPQAWISRLQYLDTKVYLPEDILMKVDRMSMANSLETRAPLLDYNIVEFAASIPWEIQMQDGRGKYILRKVAARYLPESILNKKKQGFAIPREQWFQRELKTYAWDLLTSERFQKRGYFKNSSIRKILQEHAKGQRDYSLWIWSLINFELWHQAFVDVDTKRI